MREYADTNTTTSHDRSPCVSLDETISTERAIGLEAGMCFFFFIFPTYRCMHSPRLISFHFHKVRSLFFSFSLSNLLVCPPVGPSLARPASSTPRLLPDLTIFHSIFATHDVPKRTPRLEVVSHRCWCCCCSSSVISVMNLHVCVCVARSKGEEHPAPRMCSCRVRAGQIFILGR